MIDIEAVLPHRPPFLFVDRILEFEPGKWAKGVKNVTRNEWFFAGHYPGEPIMPGVLILESIAQMSAFAVERADSDEKPSVGMIAQVRGIRLLAPVVPGDQVELYFEILSRRGPYLKGSGTAAVNGTLVAQAKEIIIVAKREAADESSARRQ